MPPYNLAPGEPMWASAPTPSSKVSWIPQGGALPVRGWTMLSPYFSHNFFISHSLFLIPHFAKYPILEQYKKSLYEEGAIYASMSGSGSTMFGIFEK